MTIVCLFPKHKKNTQPADADTPHATIQNQSSNDDLSAVAQSPLQTTTVRCMLLQHRYAEENPSDHSSVTLQSLAEHSNKHPIPRNEPEGNLRRRPNGSSEKENEVRTKFSRTPDQDPNHRTRKEEQERSPRGVAAIDQAIQARKQETHKLEMLSASNRCS